jgi:L-alanine-DL-glutamate epimerase-like enolase superfamily enzyme/ribosomal protein S18 acetylase RimI-like enzyme
MTTAEPGTTQDTLRTARQDDLPAMADVFIAAWRRGYRGLVPDDILDNLHPAAVAADLATGLDHPRLTTTLALAPDGRPIGFTRHGDDDDHPGAGYLAALYVDPAASGSGVGRRLLRHALDSLAGREIRLWVFDGNDRARGLYEHAGFRTDGTRRTDPRWRVPQIRMRRPARNHARRLPPLPDTALPHIQSVVTSVVHRPLRRPFRTALRTVHQLRAIEVALRTTDGHVAYGTAVATPAITGDTEEAVLAALQGSITAALRRRPGTLADALAAIAACPAPPAARAAADIAVHHLAAQAAGAGRTGKDPLAVLLGNEPAPVRTDVTVSVDSPAAMAAAAREAVTAGFDTLKLKLADPALDVDRVAEVHAALGDHRATTVLRVDANQAWTRDEAVRTLDAIAARGIDLELVEQPVAAHDIDGLAYVRRRSPWPVLADESVFTAADVRRVADASAADLVNLKLLKCGGLAPARDVVDACAETGLGLLVGCMLEPAEGVTAARALAAAATFGPLAHDLDAPWWTGS